MREIRLYGALGREFGRVHRFNVGSVAEALRALQANFPRFQQAFLEAAEFYRVRVGRAALSDAKEARLPVGEREPIRIVPVVRGAKSGWSQILIGAALIAASFVPGLNVAVYGTVTVANLVGTIGFSMVLGGVANLLSPPPKLDANSAEERKPSYIFNGAQNVSAQGSAVPILYGRLIVGSVVVSAGISTNEEPI